MKGSRTKGGKGGGGWGKELKGSINRFAGLIYSGSVGGSEMQRTLPSITKADKE